MLKFSEIKWDRGINTQGRRNKSETGTRIHARTHVHTYHPRRRGTGAIGAAAFKHFGANRLRVLTEERQLFFGGERF